MIVAILEAGFARRRPAEMLMAPVAGEPMIWRMVQRARLARTLTKVVVAVSRDPADDALTGYLTSRGVPVLRGEPDDGLGGYARCVRQMGADHVVCLAADTPLLDPGLIDEAVRYALACRTDVVGTIAYPQGMAVTVVASSALLRADGAAQDEERADALGFIQDNDHLFPAAGFRARRDWSAMDWRADNPMGFVIAREAFETLCAADAAFGLEEVLDYLDNRPDLAVRRTIQAA